MVKSHFSSKKWNLESIETQSCDHSNYSSWCVECFCGQKVECFISYFSEISQNITFSHFLPQYTYKLTKTQSFSYSISLVITCGVFLWGKSGIFTNHCKKCGKISFYTKKWNLELIKTFHVTTLITHHDVLNISVVKNLNVLSAILRNIPKCYIFTPFCPNTHVNWLKPHHLATLNHFYSMWSLSVIVRNCLIDLFSLSTEKLSIFFSQHLMQVINCTGQHSMCRVNYRWHHSFVRK